jgi:hypothetical protein
VFGAASQSIRALPLHQKPARLDHNAAFCQTELADGNFASSLLRWRFRPTIGKHAALVFIWHFFQLGSTPRRIPIQSQFGVIDFFPQHNGMISMGF